MTIINRKSPELTLERNIALKETHIRVGGKEVFFTAQACVLCGVTGGKYVHFINDENNWSFFINNDPDGFQVKLVDSRSGTRNYRINSSGLVVMILKSFGFKKSKKFSIEKTKMEQGKSPVFKITLSS